MNQTDAEFLKAVGIEPAPRDRWHWLRHRWSPWTEPVEVAMQGIGILVQGKTWTEHQQERWCLTCRIRERRQVKWGS